MFLGLFDLPTASQAALICATCICVSLIGVIFLRPVVRAFVRKQAHINAIVGNFLGVFGVIYGILMGLLAVAAYENNASIEASVILEGTAVFSLYRSASTFPEPTRTALRRELRGYADFVIEKEWPQMRRGELARGGGPYLDRIEEALAAHEPSRRGEEATLSTFASGFHEFLSLRAKRLYGAMERIPGIMWWVVLLGAGINIVMFWMFDMKVGVQLILTGLFAFYLGAVISLIVIMDSPLRGDYGIGPEVFELLRDYMQRTVGS